MAFAVILSVTESQREVFYGIYREAGTSQFGLDMPPHITLATLDGCDPKQLHDVVDNFAHHLKALEIHFSAIAMFPVPKPVVYAQPTVTADLLDLQRNLIQALGDMIDQCRTAHMTDQWTPHLTLDISESLASAFSVISVAYNSDLRRSFLFDELTLIEYHPIRTLKRYPLSA